MTINGLPYTSRVCAVFASSLAIFSWTSSSALSYSISYTSSGALTDANVDHHCIYGQKRHILALSGFSFRSHKILGISNHVIASSSVTVSRCNQTGNDAYVTSSSHCSPSCTRGPYLPTLTKTVLPVLGSFHKTLSQDALSAVSVTCSTVS